MLLLVTVLLNSAAVHAQIIGACTAASLSGRIKYGGDTIYVVNFWATWCAPCIRELPEFDRLNTLANGAPVKVLLVSLDFKTEYPVRLNTFVQRMHLKPEVLWLNETDANTFIPKLYPDWEGTVPATWIIWSKTGRQRFLEGVVDALQITTLLSNG